jgi:hypothetical protein
MAQITPELSDALRRFIEAQHIFFVATAADEGRINLSPKGMDTFRCLDERRVAYLDLTGSGNETAAHLQENDRITIMLCSFTEKPLILRIYGRGEAIRTDDERWNDLAGNFELLPGTRQIIRIDIDFVQTSCGYAVPVYELKAERPRLLEWALEKGDEGLEQYRLEKNTTSLDGRKIG